MPITLESYVLVALGGAVGASARYAAAVHLGPSAMTTAIVNVSGSLLIGLLIGSPWADQARYRLLLGTGFLGGYTTFSALELETYLAVRAGQLTEALANLIGSVVLGFIAAGAGLWLGSRLR